MGETGRGGPAARGRGRPGPRARVAALLVAVSAAVLVAGAAAAAGAGAAPGVPAGGAEPLGAAGERLPGEDDTGDPLATVVFRAAPEVAGDAVYLGEIAEIRGSEPVTRALARVVVGRSPAPGSSRRLAMGFVRAYLRRAGWDPGRLRFLPPDLQEVEVSRPAGGPAVTGRAEDGQAGPLLVRAGARVVLVARVGAVRVITYGIARQSGAMGERVAVENLRSGKRVWGRVSGEGVVEVEGGLLPP